MCSKEALGDLKALAETFAYCGVDQHFIRCKTTVTTFNVQQCACGNEVMNTIAHK